MGEFDVGIDLGSLLPTFSGQALEWQNLKSSWRGSKKTDVLLNSISLTLKAIRIEMGEISPQFNITAEQFTHPIELMIDPADDVLFEKTCPLESTLPFIKADELEAMSDVDGGKFEMTTSNLGKWADKVTEEPEFNDAGIPFSPFVIGYAKRIETVLKEITVTVQEDEGESQGEKKMNRFLTVKFTMSVKIRPIFGEQKDFLPAPVKREIKTDLDQWLSRVEEAKRLCGCEVTKYAWSSVAGAAVPIPGTSVFVDIAICAKMSTRFKTLFQEAINMEEICNDLRSKYDYIPEQILISNLKFLGTYILKREAELIAESYLHKLVLSHVGNHTIRTASHWIPFLGSIVSTSMAYPFMAHTGFHLIGEYEKTYVDGFKELHGKLMSFAGNSSLGL